MKNTSEVGVVSATNGVAKKPARRNRSGVQLVKVEFIPDDAADKAVSANQSPRRSELGGENYLNWGGHQTD